MKLLFCGDFQFGKTNKSHCRIELENKLIKYFNSADAIFFNLETVLIDTNFQVLENKLKNKHIHIYNYGDSNIKYLTQTLKPDLFISTINNHTFDYGKKGYDNTLSILKKYNCKFTIGKSYYSDDKFIYLNATDHWTIIKKNVENFPENTKLWSDNCLLIDNYQQELFTYRLVEHLNKIKGHRKIIFSIHWGKNFSNAIHETTYLVNSAPIFFKKLCNKGVDIVFGHGAHHIMDKPFEIYNNKLIIYGLGDFCGNFRYHQKYNTDKSMIIKYDTDNNTFERIIVSGEYQENNCKYPKILDNLDVKKRYIGGGKTFAHEIEFDCFKPFLKKYGIELDIINKYMLYKNKKISYQNYFNDNKRNESQSNKKKLRDICINNNIPYPKTVNDLNINNLNEINNLKFPVLLKPYNGAGGKGIIDIDSINNLRKYINSDNNSKYIVQEKVVGNTYRILILYDEILFIRTNKQPFIIGDGISTVNNLIDKLNFNLKSNNKPQVRRVSYSLIKQQGYNMYDIVHKNRTVYITDIINYWNGAVNGEFIPINKVHPDNIKLFFKIQKVFDLNLVGIDFISPNLEEPYYNNNGCLLEINNSPQFNISITECPEKFIKTLIKNI